MIKAVNSIPLLYAAMLLPGYVVFVGVFDRSWYYPQLMHDSGLWSMRLLVLTVSVTPVLMVLRAIGRGREFGRWLLVRRRHFGLASFIFAALHLYHYVVETGSFADILRHLKFLEYAVGWGAFVVFLLLAVTSNQWSTRTLGRRWKPLHMSVYLGAAFAFLHWYLFDFVMNKLVLWAGLFVLAKSVHYGFQYLRRRPQRV